MSCCSRSFWVDKFKALWTACRRHRFMVSFSVPPTNSMCLSSSPSRAKAIISELMPTQSAKIRFFLLAWAQVSACSCGPEQNHAGLYVLLNLRLRQSASLQCNASREAHFPLWRHGQEGRVNLTRRLGSRLCFICKHLQFHVVVVD